MVESEVEAVAGAALAEVEAVAVAERFCFFDFRPLLTSPAGRSDLPAVPSPGDRPLVTSPAEAGSLTAEAEATDAACAWIRVRVRVRVGVGVGVGVGGGVRVGVGVRVGWRAVASVARSSWPASSRCVA